MVLIAYTHTRTKKFYTLLDEKNKTPNFNKLIENKIKKLHFVHTYSQSQQRCYRITRSQCQSDTLVATSMLTMVTQ